MQANEQRVSAPVTLRELYGVARCLVCRQQDRRCHVEYNVDQCLQCVRGEACIFERTVQRTGPSRDFSWNELIGDAEVVGTFHAGYLRGTALEHPSNRRLAGESVNNSSAAHRPGWVDNVEQAGSMGPNHDRQLDATSITRGSSYKGTAERSYYAIAHPITTIRATPSASRKPATSLRFPGAYPDLSSSQPSQEAYGFKLFNGWTNINLASGTRNDEARPGSDFIPFEQHSRTNPKADKSHVCPIPLCPQQFKGFSTFNDLQRHQKSAHGIQSKATREYKCFGTECSRRDKLWPRLDNFRQHLIRMHKDEDTDDLIRK
jgi:hypothetical protein